VIDEVDDALRTLLNRDTYGGTDVEVVFDAPTREWSSRRRSPTVDLYLYDIREDMRRREVGRLEHRAGGREVVQRTEPPRWYKLCYILTAWTNRPEDEHRLLSAAMRSLVQYESIPADLVSGSLSDIGLPVPISCGVPPPEERALSDVWSALGGDLKPSLDVVVIAPLDLRRPIHVGKPVLESPRLGMRTDNGVEERDGRPQARRATSTRVPPSLADEEVDGGGSDQRGRRLRIREIPLPCERR
jgi:hypothetical protein